MTARHAGFAAVTCIGGDLVNSLIEAAFQNLVKPITFDLPTPIIVGSKQVTLSGKFTVLPPVVKLVQRPDNLIAVSGRFVSELHLEGATADPVDVVVELGCSLLVGLFIRVVNDRFQVGLDLSQASVTAVSVRVTDGPPLVSPYGGALTSGPVLAALTAALRALPPGLLHVSPSGFPATIRLAPKRMPCGASLFELPAMFDASFSISRVVPRVLGGQIAFGVDIAGITNGDPNALGTLFGVTRKVWVRTNGPDGPNDFNPHNLAGIGNIAASVNPDALVALLEGPLSQGTRGAFIDCHVALDGFSMSFGTFTPNLMPQDRIEGPTFRVGAAYFTSPGRDGQSRLTPGGIGIPALVRAQFAVHFQQFDGPTDFVSDHSEYWFIKVYDVDIDVPWWVTAGLVVLGLTIPLVILPVAIVLGSILPTLLENAEADIQRTAQSGINGAVSETGLATLRGKLNLPAFPKTPGTVRTNLISMTGEGFEIFASYSLATREVMRPDRNIDVTIDGSAVQDGIGRVVGVVDAKPLTLTVKLKDGIVSPADPSVRVSWEVRRADTNVVLFQQDLPYSSRVLSGIGGAAPSPRRIVIDRTSPALMPIDQFLVTLRVYRPLSGRQKEFGSSRFKISVEDRFDRSHPFVHWNGWAAGGPKPSKLHRTAAPGRCSMIMRAAHRAKFLYLDALPFPLAEIEAHRKEICPYCFFGGPDKSVPLI